MNSRDKILNAIATNQPELVALPIIDLDSVISFENNFNQFKTVLESIGGKVELIQDISVVNNLLRTEKSNGKLIINTLDEVDKQVVALTSFELEKLEKVCIKASLGVAENGAVWVYESQMMNRLLPFICQHLILVIDKAEIVPTMHHAYKKIDIAKEGFGIFIAGPSKTADIEQSLVIGAHGARTATIYVIE
jgi:L-lactate dehydrogenase complex protein LldG